MTVQQFLDVLSCRYPDLAGRLRAATDPRWARLDSPLHASAVLRDRFRGALVGGAIRDAMSTRRCQVKQHVMVRGVERRILIPSLF